MKAKRLTGLLVSLLTIGVLTSCSNPEAEQKALKKVLDSGIASTVASGSPLNAQDGDNLNTNTLKGDDNDALSLTTKQITKIDGNSFTVELEWSWAEEYNEVISMTDIEGDETHKKMSFVYPGESATANTEASFKVSAKCGSQTDERTFNVLLVKTSIKYDEVKIADLYKMNAAGTNFNIVDESTGYIKTNYGQKYYYISVVGKVIYVAADQNWALIADGKDVLQLYRVDAASDKDLVKVGKYIRVYGDMSNGYGNLQLAYINKVEQLEEAPGIADFVEQTVPVGLNNKTSADFKSFFSGISNAVTTFTGTIVAKDDISFNGQVRQTIDLDLGGTGNTIVLAYDYHVAKSGAPETLAAYKAVLDGAKNGDKITVRGTLRWSNADSANKINDNGAWTITPFDKTDLAKA